MAASSARAEERAAPRAARSCDDATLAACVRAGDVHAFEAVVRAHYAGLCAFVARLAGPAGDGVVEEIVQDVLLAVWRRRAEWTPAQSVRAYLYGAVRHGVQRWRKRDRLMAVWQAGAVLEDPRHADPADAALAGAEVAGAAARAVARLPARCRLVFELHRQHGLSYTEVAAALGISPKTVDVQMGRALKALRASLADYLPVVVAVVAAGLRWGARAAVG